MPLWRRWFPTEISTNRPSRNRSARRISGRSRAAASGRNRTRSTALGTMEICPAAAALLRHFRLCLPRNGRYQCADCGRIGIKRDLYVPRQHGSRRHVDFGRGGKLAVTNARPCAPGRDRCRCPPDTIPSADARGRTSRAWSSRPARKKKSQSLTCAPEYRSGTRCTCTAERGTAATSAAKT
jgi:hypothetical protein